MCSTKTKTLFLFVLSMLGLNVVFAQNQAHLALVTDVKGAVTVSRASDGAIHSASWGMQLYLNDQIKTDDGAEASILFSNNNLLTLGGSSALTISAGQEPSLSSSQPIRSIDGALAANATDLALHRAGHGEIAGLAGLRSGGNDSEIEVIAPRNTKISTTRPKFTWHTDTEYESFQVRLFDNNGLVWSGETTDTFIQYPEESTQLEPGNSYFWQVEGEELFGSVKSSLVALEVLSEESRQRVASEESKIAGLFGDHSNDSSYHFLLGSLYETEGLYASAIDSFLRIVDLHPDASAVHAILGRLYTNIGLNGPAASAYQRAFVLGAQH